MRNKFYTFEDDLKKRLRDPEFKKAWGESEVEYLLAKKLIEKRLRQKLSQRDLARKASTTQAVISRVESTYFYILMPIKAVYIKLTDPLSDFLSHPTQLV